MPGAAGPSARRYLLRAGEAITHLLAPSRLKNMKSFQFNCSLLMLLLSRYKTMNMVKLSHFIMQLNSSQNILFHFVKTTAEIIFCMFCSLFLCSSCMHIEYIQAEGI